MTTAIWLRLSLQPAWVQFLVRFLEVAPIAAVYGAGTNSTSRSISSTVISALVFGVVLAAALTYTTRGMHTALTEAVAGLDQRERSQAIAAVTRGMVPADQRVRSASVRLGRACLGGKSPDQLKRPVWIASAILVAVGILSAVMRVWPSLFLMALVLPLVPLGMLRARRIQRHVALLTENAAAQ
jgi:Flp pilus assembly protein TadB